MKEPVMHAQRKMQQTQTLLLGVGGLLALCYFFMYRPLSSTSAALDKPLIDLWQRLVTTNSQDQTVEGIDLDDVEATFQQAQMSRVRFDGVRDRLLARLQLEPFIAGKLSEPFQLIDFQNERQIRLEALRRLAESHSVKLDPAVIEAFPNFPADSGPSSQLWAEMALADNALGTAIRCGVSRLSKIDIRRMQTATRVRAVGQRFDEIRIDVELDGSMPAVSMFLASLPMRSEELVPMGLPEGPPEKMALFIDRILLKKLGPENPDRVSLKTVLAGYVPAYNSAGNGAKPSNNGP